MADSSRDGSLSLDPSAQAFTTPRPTFSTPMTPPFSSPTPSSAKLSASSTSASAPPPAPPSEAPSGSDELGPSASVSVASSLLSRRTTDAGSSIGADDDDRSIAATSATGDDDAASAVAAAGSSVAPSSKGGRGSSSSSSVATRDDESVGRSAGGSRAGFGRPPVDPQLVEALTGKDRLYVLSVAQDMEGLFGNPSRASLSYSPNTSFHRRIVYQCAAFLGLQTSAGDAKAIVVRLPTELYALTSAPYRVINIAPAPQASSSIANQPPSGFRLMRRDPANSLPVSRGASPGGEDAGDRGNRKKSYEQRQAEYDAARNKIFNAASPSETSSDAGATAGVPSAAGGRINGGGPTRGLSGDRRASGRSRASSHASSTDSVPVVFVEPPPSAAAASASGSYIYQSAAVTQPAFSAPLRPSAPTFDPSLPASATNVPVHARSYAASPVYASVGGHAPAMTKSSSGGGGSPQPTGSSSASRGSYRNRNSRPSTAAQQQASYGSTSTAASSRGAGSHPGHANQPRLYEPTSQRSQRAPATHGTASDWQVTQQPSPSLPGPHQQQQPHQAMMPAQAFYQPQPPPHMAGQAYMFIPFNQPDASAGSFIAPYGQQAFLPQPSPLQPQAQVYAQSNGHGSPYNAHSYPVSPAAPAASSSPSAHYFPVGSAGQPSYYALPAGSQQPQYAHFRSDGASSAPPYHNGHHSHGHTQPTVSYGPGGQPYHVYGVPQSQPPMVVPQPQHFAIADPTLQPWTTASSSGGTGGGPSVYHRSDSSVSSFGEGSSRPQSRGSSSSRLSFGASSGLSSLRQQAWGSDVGTTSGSRQSWASTSNAGASIAGGTSNASASNAGTTSGRSGRRRSSGAGTDRPPSPQSSTTSSVSRTRGLSQLAHIPPPKDHPLPPRPDWSVGHQQFDLKRPDGPSAHTPPRLGSTNDFPPLTGIGPGALVQPQLTSPQASGDGIWSGGRGRAAVLRSTTGAPLADSDQQGSQLLNSPDRTSHSSHPASYSGSPKRTTVPVLIDELPQNGLPLRVAIPVTVRAEDVSQSHATTANDPDDEDDFEPRRPIVRSSAALFDPSPAAVRPSGLATVVSGEDGVLREEERATIEDKLASINLGLSAGEGQGTNVIGPSTSTAGAGGPGLTYSSIVRRA